MKTYRQGDVLLKELNALTGTFQQDLKNDIVPDRVVLALGEATGHHHSIAADHGSLHQSGATRYLQVKVATKLEHQEHDPISLEPGVYQVVIQREFDPFADNNSRFVAD
jgi:hypothetical protein